MNKHFIGMMLAFLSATLFAQENWPKEPIKIVVGFAAGGPTDAAARALADHMSKNMGNPVIVENRTGAGTAIAAEFVRSAKADGHTLLYGGFSQALLPHVGAARYHPVNDFSGISRVTYVPQVLIVRNNLAQKNFADIVSYAKKAPGKFNFGIQGQGSSLHYALELLQESTGTTFTPVFYRGSAPAIADLIAGHIDMMFDVYGNAEPFIKSGKVHVIGIVTPQRSKLLPEVPTLAELGAQGFSMSAWLGLFAPKGTPQPILERLSAEIKRASANEDYVRKIEGIKNEVSASTPAEMSQEMSDTYIQIGKTIDRLGMRQRWQGK